MTINKAQAQTLRVAGVVLSVSCFSHSQLYVAFSCSLGNHELDNGVAGLVPFVRNVTCPVLAANLILDNVPTLKQEPNLLNSVVVDVDGVRVGIVGYLTPDTKILAIKNNVEYIEEVIAIRKEVAKLKRQNVTIFIALGHSGFTKDLEIAKEVEDIDLVIGGHTNTFLYNGVHPDEEVQEGPYPILVKQKSGRSVLAMQAYAFTKYLGKIKLVFDKNGEIVHYEGNPVLLDNTIQQDPEVLKLVYSYRTSVMEVAETVIGNASVFLDGQSCRLKECNMGNLITDAIIHKYASHYKGKGWTDAPIAIIQGGGIRASISYNNPPVNITTGDLLTILPFDSTVVKVSVNGSNLIKMLEHAVAKYNLKRPPGQFLQFSGLKVEYDFNNYPGKRVKSVLVRCGLCKVPQYSNLNMSASYNILMPSFLSMGGDGFAMFEKLPSVNLDYDEFKTVFEYITTHSPIHASLERRIIIHNEGKLKNNSYSLKLSTLLVTVLIICYM